MLLFKAKMLACTVMVKIVRTPDRSVNIDLFKFSLQSMMSLKYADSGTVHDQIKYRMK